MTPSDKAYYAFDHDAINKQIARIERREKTARILRAIGYAFLIWPYVGILIFIPCMFIASLLSKKPLTPEDKSYYSDSYYPLFKLMSEEHGLTLLEQDMNEIINCVRKMDEAALIDFIANPPSGWKFYEKEHYF